MKRLAWLLVSTLAVAGCRNAAPGGTPTRDEPPIAVDRPKGDDATHVDEPEHEELPKRVKLAPKVIADAKIRVERVTSRELGATVSLSGELSADPDRSARVASPVAGQLVRVLFKEGETVKAGAPLALVRVAELGKVRGAQHAAAAKAEAAKSNASRLEELSEKGLAAKQEAISARADADALAADASALNEQLAAMGTGAQGAGSDLVLRAPVSGIVVTRDAVVGQPLATDQTIASVADLSEAWFVARLFEKDLARVTSGATAEVVLNAYPTEHFSASVEQIGHQVDPIGRTVTARLRLRNRSDLLRLGLYGTATVGVKPMDGASSPVLTVPRTALVDLAGKKVVFVREKDGDFEVHEVIAGAAAPGVVEIVRGLRDGEDVVVEGAFTLKSVVLKGTLAEED